MTLIVLGVGSVQAGVPIVFGLASYFGERPLEIVFWDPNEERLELFDRLARKAFEAMKCTHGLRSTLDLAEALEEPGPCLVACEAYAQKQLTAKRLAERAVTLLATTPMEWEAPRLPWPEPVEETSPVPHQILRWLNGEEYLPQAVDRYAVEPFHRWLDEVSSLPFLS